MSSAVGARRVLRGASGKEARVKKRRTFSGALCSENQDVPGSSSSFKSESASESLSSFSLDWGSGAVFVPWLLLSLEMCARVRA